MASQMTERPDCLHCTLPNKKCYGNCGKRNQSAGYDHRLTDGVKGKEDPKVRCTKGNRRRMVFL